MKTKSKCLKLITDNIIIKAKDCSRVSFFENYFGNMRCNIEFGSNTENWILLFALPNTIPAFEGLLVKEKLLTCYRDGDKEIRENKDCHKILNELWNPEPFTILEFWAIHRELFLNPKLNLFDRYNSHIFFVRLENSKTVIVDTRYDDDSKNGGCNRTWVLSIDDPNSHIQYIGDPYVFSRK